MGTKLRAIDQSLDRDDDSAGNARALPASELIRAGVARSTFGLRGDGDREDDLRVDA